MKAIYSMTHNLEEASGVYRRTKFDVTNLKAVSFYFVPGFSYGNFSCICHLNIRLLALSKHKELKIEEATKHELQGKVLCLKRTA